MVTKKKAEAEIEAKTSVKSYQRGIDAEKQKMATYSKKFETTVRSLQAEFKKHSKDFKSAALKMRGEGINNMKEKVGKFKKEIEDQIKENKESASHMEANVKYFLNEIKKKEGEFKSYARGPFRDYIKAFWGVPAE